MSFHVMNPLQLSGFGIQAMDVPGKISNKKESGVWIDRDSRDTPVHGVGHTAENCIGIGPNGSRFGDVTRFRRIDADQVTDSFSMFGILSRSHVNPVFIKD